MCLGQCPQSSCALMNSSPSQLHPPESWRKWFLQLSCFQWKASPTLLRLFHIRSHNSMPLASKIYTTYTAHAQGRAGEEQTKGKQRQIARVTAPCRAARTHKNYMRRLSLPTQALSWTLSAVVLRTLSRTPLPRTCILQRAVHSGVSCSLFVQEDGPRSLQTLPRVNSHSSPTFRVWSLCMR